jgi:hypothetical protein
MFPIGPLALATVLAPAIAIVVILPLRRPRAAETINLIASAVSLASIGAILLSAPRTPLVFWNGYVVIDSLGVWTVLCAAISGARRPLARGSHEATSIEAAWKYIGRRFRRHKSRVARDDPFLLERNLREHMGVIAVGF